MAGKPYKVGRFAHTLRVRLMREHLGIDVDAMYEDDLMAFEPTKGEHDIPEWDPDAEQEYGKESGVTRVGNTQKRTATKSMVHDVMDGASQGLLSLDLLVMNANPSSAMRGTGEIESKGTATLFRKMGWEKGSSVDATAGEASLREERTTFTKEGEKVQGFASSVVPTLEEKTVAEHQHSRDRALEAEASRKSESEENQLRVSSETGQVPNGQIPNGDTDTHADKSDEPARVDGELYGTPANGDAKADSQPPKAQTSDGDEEDQKGPAARSTLRRHLTAKLGSKSSARPWLLPTPTPHVDPYGFEDPICDGFWKETWVASAVHNVSNVEAFLVDLSRLRG